MAFSDLGTALPLAGGLLGITFGLVSGVSKEVRIKQIAISAFGTIIVAFTGVSFYAYGYSLEVLLNFLICSFIGFIATYIAGLGYRSWKDRPWATTIPSPPTPWEEMEIQKNAPKIYAKLEVYYNIFLGYKIEISLVMKNALNVILDHLGASLKITEFKLKEKEKIRFYDLPNLLPSEERKYVISERIGRSLNHAIDLKINRKGVLLEEIHWTLDKSKYE
ncbi:hypothetical protein KEJ37_00445 [Candidatus Bathyarchaeota archaeon]|nr:hypothetical protein [Candidatus Bathyarchaeota archaeon]